MSKLLFWIMLDYTLILQQVNLLKIYFFFFSFKPLSRVLNYISLSPSANRTSSGIIMWLISLSLIINSHDIISENKCPRSISRQDHSTWIPAFCCDIREIYFAARSQTFCQLCPENSHLVLWDFLSSWALWPWNQGLWCNLFGCTSNQRWWNDDVEDRWVSHWDFSSFAKLW